MKEYSALAIVYDMLRAHEDINQWASYVYQIMMDHGIKPPHKVADVACGTGDMTLYLYDKGYQVVGVDRSQEMLEEAYQKSMGKGIHWINQDMLDMRFHEPVDCITCVNDGVNYLLTDDALQKGLQQFHDNLKSGGLLLFDISSRAKLMGMADDFYAEEDDDVAYIWQNHFDEDKQTLTMDISFYIREEDGRFRREEEQHVQRIHDVEHVMDLLNAVGFHRIVAYSAFTKEKPTAKDQRIQFVAIRN